jgi:triacylglycerol lipase
MIRLKTILASTGRKSGTARRSAGALLMCGVLALTPLVQTAQAATSKAAQTAYPIVLVHGMLGFDTIAGIDYWYGIPGELRAQGAKVFVAEVAATNSSEVRGEQLLKQVKDVLALTGASKVNLIGHSHGGPTARYVSGVAPELVASVTTVGSPHKGSKVADVLGDTLPAGSLSRTVVVSAVNAFSSLLGILSGNNTPQNGLGALDSLNTVGSAKFNAKFPDGVPTTACGNGAELVNGVRYFSWSGTQPLTNVFDASDYPLSLLSAVHGEANDGLASACSSHLGTYLGSYRQNHLDEVNQLLGLRDLFSVSPVTLYVNQAAKLKQLGL